MVTGGVIAIVRRRKPRQDRAGQTAAHAPGGIQVVAHVAKGLEYKESAAAAGAVQRRIERIRRGLHPLGGPAAPRRERTGPRVGQALSHREAEVVALLAKGLRYGEIAAHVGIAARTVKFHAHSARIKSGVRDRTALLLWWQRTGAAANADPIRSLDNCIARAEQELETLRSAMRDRVARLEKELEAFKACLATAGEESQRTSYADARA